MSDRRRALGRGLGALISNSGSNTGRSDNPEAGSVPVAPSLDASAPPAEGVTWVPVDQVDPNPNQPRRVFDPSKLETLAASILQHGVLQPVVVQSVGDRYELVVGERRWRACRAAGLKEIPAVVKSLTPQSRLEVAIVENVQRNDLNPVELAYAFQALAETGATQEEIGQKVSLDRSSVANHMRLLDLTPDFQEDIEQGRLSMGHAKALLQVDQPAQRRKLRDRVIRQGLSVRATEKVARELGGEVSSVDKASRATASEPLSPDLKRVLEILEQRFQTRVRLKGGGQKGHLEIDYFDEADLTRVIDLLLDQV
jgi:ParB family chromosome partitioning protein